MTVLFSFFLRYILAPLIAIIVVFILTRIAKGKAMINLKKLIIFTLVSVIILASPSLLGAVKFEFVWIGLYITIITYLIFGLLFNLFMKTQLFRSIGFNDVGGLLVLALFVVMCLTGWIYFLVFEAVSNLNYSAWTITLTLWLLVPLFYSYSRRLFLKIPSPFYKSWVVERDLNDNEYWDNVDTFSLMQVTVKIKRTPGEQNYSSFAVRLPKDVTVGRWFNRFIEDQNIRFPNKAIEVENEDQQYGWIFYTRRWIPIFTKMLDFDEDVATNKVRNKTTLYARRVMKNNEMD